MNFIKDNLHNINLNIETSSAKSGRSFNDISLIAVTKTIPIEKIRFLQTLGINTFAENKAQELLFKYPHIKNCNWHFIGRLQTNKVKSIIDKVSLIHSVDSIKLIHEIDKRAKEINIKMDILIQVNISCEKSKGGLFADDLHQFINQALKYNNVNIKGLMCIPPFCKIPQDNTIYFKKMKKLFIDINHKNKDNIYMEYLSMGMTNDYQIAIEEGSNMVRIGNAIFGQRQ